jgi:hypothetical protein
MQSTCIKMHANEYECVMLFWPVPLSDSVIGPGRAHVIGDVEGRYYSRRENSPIHPLTIHYMLDSLSLSLARARDDDDEGDDCCVCVRASERADKGTSELLCGYHTFRIFAIVSIRPISFPA